MLTTSASSATSGAAERRRGAAARIRRRGGARAAGKRRAATSDTIAGVISTATSSSDSTTTTGTTRATTISGARTVRKPLAADRVEPLQHRRQELPALHRCAHGRRRHPPSRSSRAAPCRRRRATSGSERQQDHARMQAIGDSAPEGIEQRGHGTGTGSGRGGCQIVTKSAARQRARAAGCAATCRSAYLESRSGPGRRPLPCAHLSCTWTSTPCSTPASRWPCWLRPC